MNTKLNTISFVFGIYLTYFGFLVMVQKVTFLVRTFSTISFLLGLFLLFFSTKRVSNHGFNKTFRKEKGLISFSIILFWFLYWQIMFYIEKHSSQLGFLICKYLGMFILFALAFPLIPLITSAIFGLWSRDKRLSFATGFLSGISQMFAFLLRYGKQFVENKGITFFIFLSLISGVVGYWLAGAGDGRE